MLGRGFASVLIGAIKNAWVFFCCFGISFICGSLAFLPYDSSANDGGAQLRISLQSAVALAVSPANLVLELTPTPTGNLTVGDIEVRAGSNNITGYALTMGLDGLSSGAQTGLMHTNGVDVINNTDNNPADVLAPNTWGWNAEQDGVSNPELQTAFQALPDVGYDAVIDVNGRPILMYQTAKTQLDFAEPAVIAMFEAKPEVVISMSAEKLGKDQRGILNPYVHQNKKWDNIFHLHMYGYKSCRSFWSPGTTIDSFVRTVPIDYALLRKQCSAVKEVLDRAVAVRITAPAGTDVTFGLRGRFAMSDDGDFSSGGEGGNLPAGETFISPENGTAEGVIVYDGSISLHNKTILIKNPIHCKLENGFITDISGGNDAEALLETVTLGEKNAVEFEAAGKLEKGAGAIYARNARGIGEIGIGLNPKARIIGNMLEDEKAFRTCHFAIGSNYDDDAPALIHLDGLVTEPTIIAIMEDDSQVIIEDEGNLSEEFC